MAKVRSFNDTSSVSLAYAISDNAAREDFTPKAPMSIVPFTTESFSMQKEAQQSTAITGNRRSRGSKNTRGSANGGVTVEFGSTPFCLDMLALSMLNVWTDVEAGNPAAGQFITDGEIKRYAVWEKTIRQGTQATDRLDHEVYYGNIVNEATMEFGDAELITLALTTIGAYADYTNALAGADNLGGSLASAKVPFEDYEIADSSNNLANIEIRDADGALMEVTFSDASLAISNNAREQTGLSHEFAAGIGIGKVGVTFSGTIYYFNQAALDAHMKNKRMSVKFNISTEQGTFVFHLPNLMAQSPTSNAEGENADYTTAITLVAEEGEVTIGGEVVNCVLAIEHVPTP